jgi:hypothetical protein
MGSSYAVIWREASGPLCAGELELGASRLRLEGASRSGSRQARTLHLADIASVRIGHARAERLDGRASVVIETYHHELVFVASAMGIALNHEIVDQLRRALGDTQLA